MGLLLLSCYLSPRQLRSAWYLWDFWRTRNSGFRCCIDCVLRHTPGGLNASGPTLVRDGRLLNGHNNSLHTLCSKIYVSKGPRKRLLISGIGRW